MSEPLYDLVPCDLTSAVFSSAPQQPQTPSSPMVRPGTSYYYEMQGPRENQVHVHVETGM